MSFQRSSQFPPPSERTSRFPVCSLPGPWSVRALMLLALAGAGGESGTPRHAACARGVLWEHVALADHERGSLVGRGRT